MRSFAVCRSTRGILLYQMEDGDTHGSVPLAHILATLPVQFDYVVIVGDPGSEATKASDLVKTQAWLAREMQQVAGAGFVRVYRRPGRGNP